MKLDIKITDAKIPPEKCVLCLREINHDYFDISIEYDDGSSEVGHYRKLCNYCHCALKRHFTGVD